MGLCIKPSMLGDKMITVTVSFSFISVLSICGSVPNKVVRGVDFCHNNNIIHRDVKPENVLVSTSGVIKLCDFGFARLVTNGDIYTDYVATRWYRAPELLVPDPNYGKAVDIWAIGCLFAEMMSGEPLFPGDSDIDQLFLIIRVMGKPSSKHQQLILRNPIYRGLKRGEEGVKPLNYIFPSWSEVSLDFLGSCLKMDPLLRPTSIELLQHLFLNDDNFSEVFALELGLKIVHEYQSNPLLRKFQSKKNKECTENDERIAAMRRTTFIEPLSLKLALDEDYDRKQPLNVNRFISSSQSRPETMEMNVEETENRLEGRSARDVPMLASPLQPISLPKHRGFQNETVKNSPLLQNTRINQIGIQPRRSQMIYRLDRPFEGSFNSSGYQRESVAQSPPVWLAAKRVAPREAPSWKNMRTLSKMEQELTLPNLNGAIYSPSKGIKKKITSTMLRDEEMASLSRNQTPSAGSRVRGNPTFPYM